MVHGLPLCHLARQLARSTRLPGGRMGYTVIIENGRESGYVALCPTLPGCVSQGRTKREAIRNIKEAIEAYIEALLETG